MTNASSANASREPSKSQKLQYLASVCGVCGSLFEPRVAHYNLLSQKRVSTQLRKRHGRRLESGEACPRCVEAVLNSRKSFRLPFISRIAQA